MPEPIISSESSLATNRRIQGSVLLVLALLAVFLFAQSIKSFKEYKYIGGGVPAATTITITGEGEETAIPDMTQFSFTVIERAKTVAEAQQKATAKVDTALAIVREGGVEERHIRTVSYTVEPQYEYSQVPCAGGVCPPLRETLVGFQAAQSIEIKIKDSQKAGDLITKITQAGVQNVSGLTFTVEDDEVVKTNARNKAIEDAEKKARALADALDVDLVRVVGFSDGSAPPMPYATMKDQALGNGTRTSEEAAQASLPTGENRIVSNVSITYEIR